MPPSYRIRSINEFVDFIGADGGSRTLTPLLAQDFKSCASTGSATSAFSDQSIVLISKCSIRQVASGAASMLPLTPHATPQFQWVTGTYRRSVPHPMSHGAPCAQSLARLPWPCGWL